MNRPESSKMSTCGTGLGSPASMMRARVIDSRGDSDRGSRRVAARLAVNTPRCLGERLRTASMSSGWHNRRRMRSSPTATRRGTLKCRATSTNVRCGVVNGRPDTTTTSPTGTSRRRTRTPARRIGWVLLGRVTSMMSSRASTPSQSRRAVSPAKRGEAHRTGRRDRACRRGVGSRA